MDENNIIINEQKEINKENEKIKGNENINIINRIKLNKFCIYCCFLFVRKQRNIKNILLDEGMKIVSEKLDILYLFRVLYKYEKLQEKFAKKKETIEMSDECINDLNLLNNKKIII